MLKGPPEAERVLSVHGGHERQQHGRGRWTIAKVVVAEGSSVLKVADATEAHREASQ